MYNSLSLRIVVRAYKAFNLSYKRSVFLSIVDAFKRCISYLTNSSIFINIFTKDLNIIEKSLFYKIYSKVINLGTYIFRGLNNLFKRIGEDSIAYTNISKLFRAIIAISIDKGLENLLDNSFIYKFIKDLFIIDEWGE